MEDVNTPNLKSILVSLLTWTSYYSWIQSTKKEAWQQWPVSVCVCVLSLIVCVWVCLPTIRGWRPHPYYRSMERTVSVCAPRFRQRFVSSVSVWVVFPTSGCDVGCEHQYLFYTYTWPYVVYCVTPLYLDPCLLSLIFILGPSRPKTTWRVMDSTNSFE